MAKKMFTVGATLGDTYKDPAKPFVKFGGAWLKDYGFNVGDRLELIQGRNMLILVKSNGD
jgi:hypothetical protein